MHKVVYLPLDERPCNYQFPFKLFNGQAFNIIRPGLEIMGNKKIPGDLNKISSFILEETKKAYGLVIAIDTLLYGGIVPSRLHHDSTDVLKQRLALLKTVKNQNPEIKIFAYHLIMRCPQYSLADEEPDYYAICGKEIFQYGYIKHKMELHIASREETDNFNNLDLNQEYLNDFLQRRKINTTLTIESVNYVKRNIIDFLIIPQDDSSEYGWTALDQKIVRKAVETGNLQLKVLMYPGADEVGNTLFSRMMCEALNKKPLVYLKYNSFTAPKTIPSLEDRYLDTTIKYQVIGAGGLVASSLSEADIVLFINAPSDQMISAPYQELKGAGFTTQRNLIEFMEYMDYCINTIKKPVIVADVAFGNGSDLELIGLLETKGLTMKVSAYAGWNTSANSLGTCIPHGFVNFLSGETSQLKTFLASRYIEDAGYCALVRRKVTENNLQEYGYNYFDVKEERGIIANIVKEELLKFVDGYLPSIKDKVVFNDVYMPWRRMYEIGLDISYK